MAGAHRTARRARYWTATAVVALATASPAHGQQPPDAGALLRESTRPDRQLPDVPQAAPARPLADTGVKVTVRRFVFEGAASITPERLAAELNDLVGRELGFAGLQAAADRVAAFYRTQGLHATVTLPEQTLADGIVRLVVIEGRFSRLRTEAGPGRAPATLIERMLEHGQTPGRVIDTRALERGTLLANEVPGARVSTVLSPGAEPGTSDIVGKVDRRPLLSGAISFDNHDPRATGSEQISLVGGAANPLGLGDELQFLGAFTGGKRFGRLAYGVPLGPSGLRFEASGSYLDYTLIGAFRATGGRGAAQTGGARLVYPVVRSQTASLLASVQYERRTLRNDSAVGNLSDKHLDLATLALRGDRLDRWGGGGAFIGSAQLTAGSLDLRGNPDDFALDRLGPRRQGDFVKLVATLGRLQRLSRQGSLWLSLTGQWANKNLDSSEQFFLGGVSGVRAYPALEGSGDNAVLGTVEYRHRLGERVQLAAFYDGGWTQRAADPLPGARLNSFALHGAGASIDWRLGGAATLRAFVAQRIGRNPIRDPRTGQDTDGSRREPRAWLQLTVPFSTR